ncbi:MAG: hypothetical protein PT942_04935 [Eubacteriales bacterium]|nr:hypothetical protein [Eubacteriales bacterium]
MRYIYVYLKENGEIISRLEYSEYAYKSLLELAKDDSINQNYIVSDEDFDFKSINSMYRIKDGKFTEKTEKEKEDYRKYGRTLSDEERARREEEEKRQLEIQKEREFQSRVKPTRDEILKAEVKLEMIEMLGLEKGV